MGQASSQPTAQHATQVSPSSGCPMHAQDSAAAARQPPQCPVDHNTTYSTSSTAAATTATAAPARCPVDHGNTDLSALNQIPSLAQSSAPGQATVLPIERAESSIPRSSEAGGGNWEYPSPQQFHNALLRKGMETPEEHVEIMVQIHNFLNERAWDEVLRWERRYDSSACVELSRFRGRPGELSPKARFWLFAGWLLPTRFNSEPPFDRHDWIVRRCSTGEEVRYVIDYYSAPPEPDGSPVFSLDVRPALDSFGSIQSRITVATEETWDAWKQSCPARGGGSGNTSASS